MSGCGLVDPRREERTCRACGCDVPAAERHEHAATGRCAACECAIAIPTHVGSAAAARQTIGERVAARDALDAALRAEAAADAAAEASHWDAVARYLRGAAA